MNYLLKYLVGFLILSSCMLEHDNISSPYIIEVTGDNYEWHIRYPGFDGILNTADDIYDKQNLHLPIGIETQIRLFSKDYLYFLELPDFKSIGIAVPDQERNMVFTPNKKGHFILKGNQMCAYSHENLIGELIVCSPYAFYSWRNKKFQKNFALLNE